MQPISCSDNARTIWCSLWCLPVGNGIDPATARNGLSPCKTVLNQQSVLSAPIAINCNNGSCVVLRNQGGNGNHWLTVDTVGVKSNRDGIGARLTLTAESGAKQVAMVSTAGSYQSSSDKRVHFGLGTDRRARRLEIHWPSGIVQKLDGIDADQILKVKEPV